MAMTADSQRRNFFDEYAAQQRPEDDSEKQPQQPQQPQRSRSQVQSDPSALVRYISRSVLGSAEVLSSPFPVRPRLLYCDWIASGRSLQFIEQYLQREVLPLYASTHSTASATGLQSSLYRQEARQIIGRACGASEDDVVLFAGSGSTAAIALLLDILSAGWSEAGVAASQVAFFLGPYAHHSLLLPVRERGFQLVQLQEQPDSGGVDLDELRRELLRERAVAVRVKVGFFTAASNVSGIVVDCAAVSAVCSDCGALNLWDFATAAPYCDVDLNPQRSARLAKSAVVLSPHKMVGGVSTPGLLLVKKALLSNSVPSRPGGGAVFFVNAASHRYLQNFEEREEAGTPDIVAAVRAGLVFQLRQSIAADWRQQRLQAYDALASPGLYLHPNFVSALLNDLFGIQSRSGCLCAGPYAHQCLGISAAASAELEAALLLRAEVLRPGFTRVSCHYCMDEQDVSFLCEALLFVARSGWKLLPLYGLHTDSGEWRHRLRMSSRPDRRWLGSVSYDSGEMRYDRRQQAETAPDSQPALLAAAEAEVTRVEALVRTQAAAALGDDGPGLLDARLQRLRWFMLPSEARACMLQPTAALDGLQQRAQQTVIRPPCYDCRGGSELHLEQAEQGGGHETGDFDAALSDCQAAPSDEASKAATAKEEEKEAREEDARDAGSAPAAAPSLLASLLQSEAESKARRFARRRQAAHQPETAEAPLPSRAADTAQLICRHCYHRHWQSAQQRQCVSCSCVSFEPVAAGTDAARAPLPVSPSALSPSAASCSGELRTLSRKLRSLVGRAVLEHGMIAEGDRVLVGVSGGKDSLTLLHVLLALQARAPVRFSLAAVTVDPQTPEYDPRPLQAYMRQLQLPFHYESQPVIAAARACSSAKLSICAFCARMKRGMLYSACRREGYNVLALGQHADDLCESLLMSAMHNGLLRSMKANYRIAAGDVRVIRPLLHVRERQTRLFARLAALPVIVDNCPACFEAPKERQRVKLMLAQQEAVHPNVVSSIMTAIKPLLSIRQAAETGRAGRRDGQPEQGDEDEEQ